MSLNDADQRLIHKFSTGHRELLAKSERAGCFYCQQIYEPTEIEIWIDGPETDKEDDDNGVTALCPRCGIDAVLPSAAPITLSPDLLSEMRVFWFDTSTDPHQARASRLTLMLLSTGAMVLASLVGFLAGELFIGFTMRCDQSRSLCEGSAMLGLILGAVVGLIAGGATFYVVYRRLRMLRHSYAQIHV